MEQDGGPKRRVELAARKSLPVRERNDPTATPVTVITLSPE